MMLALIKKDLRVFLVPTVGGFLMITMGYAIALSLSFSQEMRSHSWLHYADLIELTCGTGMMACIALGAAYGGSSFSIERREHSSDWLNMLPVTRGQIVISKLVAAFACMIALFIYDLLPWFVLDNWTPPRELILACLGAQAALFSLAWLFSTFLESAALSASFAIAIAFTVMMTFEGIYHLFPGQKLAPLAFLGVTSVAIVGIASFMLGTHYYLNRVEP